MFAAQWTSKGGPSLTPLSHDPAIAIVDCDCKVPFMASDVTPSPGGFGNGMSPSCVCFFGIVAMVKPHFFSLHVDDLHRCVYSLGNAFSGVLRSTAQRHSFKV